MYMPIILFKKSERSAYVYFLKKVYTKKSARAFLPLFDLSVKSYRSFESDFVPRDSPEHLRTSART